MANDIVAIHQAIQALQDREEQISTPKGKELFRREMLTVLGALEYIGYKLPNVDVDKMASIWCYELKDDYVTYGIEAIKGGVLRWAKTDNREYHQFPSVGQIMAEIRKTNKDPRAQLAKIRYEEVVKRMEREADEAFEKALTPEQRERLDALYRERIGQ